MPIEQHVISFPVPGEYLSMNVKRHHMAEHELVRLWQEAAYYGACQWRITPDARRLHGKATVRCIFPVGTRRRRDPHNWYPTVKPIIDGLTHANLWPDDDEAHVETLEPRLLAAFDKNPTVTVLIQEYTHDQ